MGTANNNSATSWTSWKEQVAHISAQLEELKAWSDSQHRLLHTRLDTQIAELQSEIKQLESEMAAGTSNEYVGRISRQLEELTAKGDAVYDLLLAVLAQRSQKVDADARH